MELTVNLGENSYPIYIENGILPHAGEYISKIFSGKKIILVSDDNALVLQIGSKANQTIKVGLTDMRAHALALRGSDGSYVSVSNQVHAVAVVNKNGTIQIPSLKTGKYKLVTKK